VRAIEKYTDAAMIEMEVLESIKKHDPKNTKPCIQMSSWFTYREHVCMVFEKYGLSLFDFMKKNKFKPFLLKHIQHFGIQILQGISYMHELSLIHTDLKPENVLFINSEFIIKIVPGDPPHEYRVPKKTSIKLIDFGSATFNSHHHTAVISTRHYRAPEVILGSGWTYPCDIFSIGCILVELFTGDAMFQTHENHEHLALFEKAFGPVPLSMIQKADKSAKKYFENGRLIWPGNHSISSQKHVQNQLSLKDIIIIEPHSEVLFSFYDLLLQLLQYEPEKRPTASEALNHPFFKLNIPEEEIHFDSPKLEDEMKIITK